MILYNNNSSLEEKKQELHNLVLNHVKSLPRTQIPSLTNAFFQYFLPSSVLEDAVRKIEEFDRVMIQFKLNVKRNSYELITTTLPLGELTWKHALSMDVREENGLCLNFVFNGDFLNSFFEFIYENDVQELAE